MGKLVGGGMSRGARSQWEVRAPTTASQATTWEGEHLEAILVYGQESKVF